MKDSTNDEMIGYARHHFVNRISRRKRVHIRNGRNRAGYYLVYAVRGFQWQGSLKSQVMHRHIVMHANAGNYTVLS